MLSLNKYYLSFCFFSFSPMLKVYCIVPSLRVFERSILPRQFPFWSYCIQNIDVLRNISCGQFLFKPVGWLLNTFHSDFLAFSSKKLTCSVLFRLAPQARLQSGFSTAGDLPQPPQSPGV